MKKKILISTGGSGGHVIPAKILIDHLNYNFEVIISTDQRGEKYLKDVSNKKIKIYTPKLNNLYLFPLNLIKILILTFKSFFILKKIKLIF
jgi:UDP-N-acetylglucosamine--N-acetylmuramyl-(pentapeptide) pyrophosphoryl-undecaprenol N-acetylglucosamine transferase